MRPGWNSCRIAVAWPCAGYSEVSIFELAGTSFRKRAVIPVVKAIDALPHGAGRRPAIATATQVTLHSLEDFADRRAAHGAARGGA